MPEAEEVVTPPDDGFEWAIVEIFGHRKHAGRAREEERFGAKMLRIDVPTIVLTPHDNGGGTVDTVEAWTTHWYGGASLFSFTLTDEVTVMRINRPYTSASRYLPAHEDDDDERPF